MQIKKNIAISDSGFLFNPSTGDSYSVNPVGQQVLKMLKEGKSLDAVKATLLAEYKVDAATVEKDLYDFSTMLSGYKLTE